MTASQYQKEYQSAKTGEAKAEAHKRLVGAERALAKVVAPVYFSALNGEIDRTDLRQTRECDVYHASWGTVDLDDATVKELTP